ncbi:MAG: site-2 protease family protein [Labilithrix sp.]|nr:site-2 protease family protein [Labilithrix sp.]
MFRNAIRIGRVFGIDFRIDSSWLFILVLVVWSLTSLFSSWHPDWSGLLSFGVAFVAAILFFGSVLFHELAHSVVARLYGIPVRDITLHMFGGVSNIEREPPTPSAEFLIAIVGPISSVLLGVAMLAIGATITGVASANGEQLESAADAISRMGPVGTLLMWLGPVNILVGVFNMIPGFPLDGGRVLRSVLWKYTGDLGTATRWSAGVGQAVGWMFIATGAAMAFGFRVPIFGRGLVPGLWLALIGMFLRSAAAQHQMGAAIEEALRGVRVSDLMRRVGWPPTYVGAAPAAGLIEPVPGDASLRTLVKDWFVHHDADAFPVFDGSRYVGIVRLDDVRRVPVEAWDARTARELASVDAVPFVAPSDDVLDALKKLGTAGTKQLPVVDAHGELVGLLFEQDISRWLELRTAASRARPGPRSRTASAR